MFHVEHFYAGFQKRAQDKDKEAPRFGLSDIGFQDCSMWNNCGVAHGIHVGPRSAEDWHKLFHVEQFVAAAAFVAGPAFVVSPGFWLLSLVWIYGRGRCFERRNCSTWNNAAPCSWCVKPKMFHVEHFSAPFYTVLNLLCAMQTEES